MILNTLIIALSVIIIEKINEQDYSKRMVLFCYCFSEQNRCDRVGRASAMHLFGKKLKIR